MDECGSSHVMICLIKMMMWSNQTSQNHRLWFDFIIDFFFE